MEMLQPVASEKWFSLGPGLKCVGRFPSVSCGGCKELTRFPGCKGDAALSHLHSQFTVSVALLAYGYRQVMRYCAQGSTEAGAAGACFYWGRLWKYKWLWTLFVQLACIVTYW